MGVALKLGISHEITDPTPKEIGEAGARIRTGWDAAEEQRRRRSAIALPVVAVVVSAVQVDAV